MDRKRLTTAITLVFLASPSLALTEETSVADIPKPAKSFKEMFGSGPQEEDVYRVDRLLLTATGSQKPVHLAPSVASVITAEDIESMGATTLNEALETVPGLHVYPSDKALMNANYSIRGIHTSWNPQVLFLVNGVPFKNTYSGSRPLAFSMPVSMISRIEVVRGPGSAIYGADAFSGTINVITKDAHEINGSKVGVRYGSFDSSQAWLQHGKVYGAWNVAMGLDYQKTAGDGDRVIEQDMQTAFDAMFGTNVSLAPGPLSTNRESVNGQLALAKQNWNFHAWTDQVLDYGTADGAAQTLGDNHMQVRQYAADLTYEKKNLLPDLLASTRLNYSYLKVRTEYQLFPPGAVLPTGADGNLFTGANMTSFPDGVFGTPQTINKQTGLEQTMLYEGLPQQRWRMALGLLHVSEDAFESKNFGPGVLNGTQSVSGGELTSIDGNDIFMDDQGRDMSFLSLQDEWYIARRWELTAGMRYDHYSDFGDTFNPRVALVWETRPELTTKLMYGRAFRPPSFSELYAKNNPSTQGNPDLKPETINTYELAFDYQPLSRLRTIASVFYYEVDDLIDLIPSLGGAINQNYRSQTGKGFELEAAWQPLDILELKGNVAYQRARDTTNDSLVPNAPGLQWYANAHWSFLPEWYLDGQYYWIGDRQRVQGDTRADIKDTDLVNITLRRKNIGKHWEAALAVRNIFNEDVREPSSFNPSSGSAAIPNDYPMEGRAIWGEVSCHY